jgi:transcription initiation factor TFIID TATA-box-binding protein
MTRLANFDASELSGRTISVQNIVAMLDLGVELDLSYLNNQMEETEYDPERYPSLIFRPPDGCTTLITRTGNALFTGATITDDIWTAYRSLRNDLSTVGLELDDRREEIEIQNIVSTSDAGREIDLNALCLSLGMDDVEYHPEQFPGATYRTPFNTVALVFSSGKIVYTGTTSIDDILRTGDHLIEEFENLPEH